jgi:hypothetical protein
MQSKSTIQTYIEDIVFTTLIIWTAFTTFLLFGPAVAVLQIGAHRHVVVAYAESNNTEFQKELNLLVRKYTDHRR